jgi:hypothetical protein
MTDMDNSFWARGTQLPDWPVKPDGTKEKAVLLCHAADNNADAEMIISLLAAYNIPCFKYYEKDGAAGRVISGFSGYGAGLYVPERMAQEAAALLESEIVEEEE